jgi:hypothetical protein
MMNEHLFRPAYRLNGFCKDFGISRTGAYKEIAAGKLKTFKVGGRVMVAGEDALAWRDSYRRTGMREGVSPPPPAAA